MCVECSCSLVTCHIKLQWVTSSLDCLMYCCQHQHCSHSYLLLFSQRRPMIDSRCLSLLLLHWGLYSSNNYYSVLVKIEISAVSMLSLNYVLRGHIVMVCWSFFCCKNWLSHCYNESYLVCTHCRAPSIPIFSYIFECSYNFPIFWWNSYIFLYYFHT